MAVGLALSAALAACSGSSDSPTVLPAISVTPSASSPSPAPDPKAAAVAVVREYFRLLNAPTSVETATSLAELMTTNCACRKVAASTRAVAERHQHYFGKTTATHMTTTVSDAAHVDVLTDYEYSATGIARADGSVVSRAPGKVGAGLDFQLVRVSGKWLIAALIYVRPGHKP